MGPETDRNAELHGWDGIATFLGVTRRTAQNYEHAHGLPVYRLPGEKGRVWALKSELELWRRNAGEQPAGDIEYEGSGQDADAPSDKRYNTGVADPPETDTAPVAAIATEHIRSESLKPQHGFPGPSAKQARGFYLLMAATALFIILIGYTLRSWFAWKQEQQPSDFRVDGKNLIVINAKGQELWRHTFAVRLAEAAYTPEETLLHSWFGDLDGDGQVELVFVNSPVNAGPSASATIICFDGKGRIRWQFTPGQHTVRDASGEMIPPYRGAELQVIVDKRPENTRIAASSNHYVDYPNQVAFLDTHGRVTGEYWHPGHLLHVAQADLDGDGRNELILGGVNNGDHQATLIILDPLKTTGVVTPKKMEDHRFELLGISEAKEKAVVLFPRSCISYGQPYTRVSSLHVNNQRIFVAVAEGADEKRAPTFYYELDYRLNVVNVGSGGLSVNRLHQELETRHIFDHPFVEQEECARLKADVAVQRRPW